MKAIVQDRFGSPEVLELREIDRPEAGAGEVVVRLQPGDEVFGAATGTLAEYVAVPEDALAPGRGARPGKARHHRVSGRRRVAARPLPSRVSGPRGSRQADGRGGYPPAVPVK
jgi:hypothetical protein